MDWFAFDDKLIWPYLGPLLARKKAVQGCQTPWFFTDLFCSLFFPASFQHVLRIGSQRAVKKMHMFSHPFAWAPRFLPRLSPALTPFPITRARATQAWQIHLLRRRWRVIPTRRQWRIRLLFLRRWWWRDAHETKRVSTSFSSGGYEAGSARETGGGSGSTLWQWGAGDAYEMRGGRGSASFFSSCHRGRFIGFK
jgi:hypothetical protein